MENRLKLHEDIQTFRDAITAAAQHLGIREVFVEKDYWVTYVLWHLSRSTYSGRVVFKGGTSLSKAYGLIQRFSEDVDLALLLDRESGNQIKNLMKKIEQTLITSPLEPDNDHPAVSKGSKIRKTAHRYPRAASSADFGSASDRLIIELNAFASPRPYSEIQISSYVAQYFSEFNKSFIAQFGLEDFPVNVLDQRRTFTEKVMGLVRASYESDENLDQIRSKVRHIYDLVKLLETQEIRDFVAGSRFFESIEEVRAEDRKNPEFQKGWIEEPISKASLFLQPLEIVTQLQNTLNQDFATLLFQGESLPPTNQIVDALRVVGKRLEQYEGGTMVGNF